MHRFLPFYLLYLINLFSIHPFYERMSAFVMLDLWNGDLESKLTKTSMSSSKDQTSAKRFWLEEFWTWTLNWCISVQYTVWFQIFRPNFKCFPSRVLIIVILGTRERGWNKRINVTNLTWRMLFSPSAFIQLSFKLLFLLVPFLLSLSLSLSQRSLICCERETSIHISRRKLLRHKVSSADIKMGCCVLWCELISPLSFKS